MAAMTQPSTLRLAVCGLHLRGQPLNSQLTDLGAKFVESCRSAPYYRLYALSPPAVSAPRKPGMVRVNSGGVGVPLETFDIPLTSVGEFMTKVNAPLTIGTLQLEDGSTVKGFLAESYIAEATEGVQDITHIGDWVAYINSDASS